MILLVRFNLENDVENVESRDSNFAKKIKNNFLVNADGLGEIAIINFNDVGCGKCLCISSYYCS